MQMNFTLVPKKSYVSPTPPPVGDFHPNKTIRQQFKQPQNSIISHQTRALETFAGFQNMIERIKSTGEPCGSCGSR